MTEHKVGTREDWEAARKNLLERVNVRGAPVTTTALLFGAAAVAWGVTVERMSGMDAGPGTDLGALDWYLGAWVTMTAAMMLPSLVCVVGGSRTPIFAAGYLAAWVGYGLAAYGVFELVRSFETPWLAWDRGGPYLAGGVIAAAGIYELTSLKRRFLRRCRTGRSRHGALRGGFANGLECVGCCVGLMSVLLAVGVMSIVWMAIVSAVIFAEKALRHGVRFTRVVAPALLLLGVWVALSPASVPALTEPAQAPMPMEGGSR